MGSWKSTYETGKFKADRVSKQIPEDGLPYKLRPGHMGAPGRLTVSLVYCNRAWKLPSCVRINENPASLKVTQSTAAEAAEGDWIQNEC